MSHYPHIERYRDDLSRLMQFGGSDSEGNIRRAFENCLDAYCREHQFALIAELSTQHGPIPDGTVKDSLRMARGYWEAKDTHDHLDAEIENKFASGYPRDNILFEDSETAVLIQDGEESMRVDMSNLAQLHALIERFLTYELTQIKEFRKAQAQFKTDLPTILSNLREAIESARLNPLFQDAAAKFLDLCQTTISPQVNSDDVREMLIQHILTKDIFLRVFAEDQFHRENNIAKTLTALEETFFVGTVRREAIDRLRTYYGAIGRAADEIADFHEKQAFLKAIYEDFYKAYNPNAADRLGVVYTPNAIVNFMIRATEHLLSKHFSRSLADDNVHILDPATGTGTFVTSILSQLPADNLDHKYTRELHANEIAILPYYIANLNIEYTYKERTGHYKEFDNLAFVDTLNNLGWQLTGATSGAVQRQSQMGFGGLTEENLRRLRRQNSYPISVVIGNPPYNDSQQDWNDFNPNDSHPEMERRISETYVAASTATKTHQYDVYKQFLRWASDRLANDGIIAFITNNAYLQAEQDDGFRKTILDEFTHLYIIDLGGNMQDSTNAGNVFGNTIGAALGFFVRINGAEPTRSPRYHLLDPLLSGQEKLNLLARTNLNDLIFCLLLPDREGEWLDPSSSDFDEHPAMAFKKRSHAGNSSTDDRLFQLHAPGVKTDRDDWVYDFDEANLRAKTSYFSDVYNAAIDVDDDSFDPSIKWSRDLRNEFLRRRRVKVASDLVAKTHFRPFVAKHHYTDFVMNDVLTKKHYQMFGEDLTSSNQVICIKGPSAKYFSVLASRRLANEKFCGTNNGGTFLFPLYRYTPEGSRVSNITPWGLETFRSHYKDQSISPYDVFCYVYCVLHDPTYRKAYESELLRRFPHIPLSPDFQKVASIGRQLLDLHLDFDTAAPYPLKREETAGTANRTVLRVDKSAGHITLDDQTTLTGVPRSAWRYQVGNRSAMEWILDQYKERIPRHQTLAENFHSYDFNEHKSDVVDLLLRTCSVSVRTVDLIAEIPPAVEL